MRRSNPDFLNGLPEMLVLRMISEQERYGYELVQLLRLRSRNILNFGEGCIYPLLHALAASRDVTSRVVVAAGRRRRYYAITPKGRRRLEAMTVGWRTVAEGVSSILTIPSGASGHGTATTLA